jgi:L-fucose isomerase-like protein
MTKLGVVCLARTTFEHELAAKWYGEVQSALAQLHGVTIVAVKPLAIEQIDADVAVAKLHPANIDALLLINGTFALGGLAMSLGKALGVPIMLWAWHEPAEQTGKLRLNSLVGVNLNASNLYKLGSRPQTIYTAHDDANAIRQIGSFARAAAALRDLQTVRVGMIGGHAPGFDNLAVNKLALRKQLGVEVVEVGLQALIAKAQAGIPAAKAADKMHSPSAEFEDSREASDDQLAKYDALVTAARDLAAQQKLNVLTLKCWGDLAEQYGIAGCGAVSVLGGHGLITGCEGDVMGALTMRLGERLTGEKAVLMDLVSTDAASNTALFWHVGCAPTCLAAAGQPKHLFSHFAGGKGLTAGFGLRPGRVTVMRLGDDGQNLRMLATTGTALDTPMNIRGTVSRVQLDGKVGAFLDEILNNGWEHHVALAYGEVLPELHAIGKLMNMPVINV